MLRNVENSKNRRHLLNKSEIGCSVKSHEVDAHQDIGIEIKHSTHLSTI